MILIFEGHDRSGKSTIAKAVADRFNTEVFMTNSKECFTDKGAFSNNSSNLSLFNYYIAHYACMLKHRDSVKKPIIIYRSFLSEMVYSEILGRETDNYINQMTDSLYSGIMSPFISPFGKTVHAGIILCYNDSLEFNDELLDDSLVLRSRELFYEYAGKVKTDVYMINTSDRDVDSYVDRICKIVEQENRRRDLQWIQRK